MSKTKELNKMMAEMKKQSDEFEALTALSKAHANLPAVVDDDYPEMRHYYESAIQKFIKAIRNNGRIK